MNLENVLKNVVLAGVGAAAVTAEVTKDVADMLVKKGEAAVEQGKVANEELKHTVKKKVREHVTVKVVKEYQDVNSAVEKMTKEEREALKEKLDALNRQELEESQAEAAFDSGEGKEGEDGQGVPAEGEKGQAEEENQDSADEG